MFKWLSEASKKPEFNETLVDLLTRPCLFISTESDEVAKARYAAMGPKVEQHVHIHYHNGPNESVKTFINPKLKLIR